MTTSPDDQMPKSKVLISWSSGKDSAWLVHTLRAMPEYEIGGLLTTVNAVANRVAMHAVRVALVEAQAAALDLPLRIIPIPSPCPNEIYERAMAEAVRRAVDEGFTHVAFGDLFLEDVRRYREERLAGTGLTPLFPLFGSDTRALARTMIAAGLRARITCLNPQVLPRQLAGREFDAALLDELPLGTDPCAERGEFHTFAYAGPMFTSPISIESGIVVDRDGFVFADLDFANSPTSNPQSPIANR
jgi:diphthamide synthase (EF-2-diphthine--ammonia ligase)